MPKSMSFKPGTGAPYAPVTEETTAQTYVARNVQPSQALDFMVSGTGQMPRDTVAAAGASAGDASGQAATAGATSAASDTRPGGGLGTPLDPEGNNDPWAKYKWWILGGLGLAMAVGASANCAAPLTARESSWPRARCGLRLPTPRIYCLDRSAASRRERGRLTRRASVREEAATAAALPGFPTTRGLSRSFLRKYPFSNFGLLTLNLRLSL